MRSMVLTIGLAIAGVTAVAASDRSIARQAAEAAPLVPLKTARLLSSGLLADSVHTSDGTERARGGPPRFAGPIGAQGVTYKGWEYVIYYTGKDRTAPRDGQYGEVVIARRKIVGGTWQKAKIDGYKVVSDDAHNRQAIAISGDGAIHVAFDHHAIPVLHYARSSVGVANDPDATRWNDATFAYDENMGRPLPPGVRVTYPAMSRFPDGDVLLYFRSGGAGNGDMRLMRYDARTHAWGPIRQISSAKGRFQGQDSTRNPYLSGPFQIGRDNSLHVAWLFREARCAGVAGPECNHDLYYAKSVDQGRNWLRGDGSPIADTDRSQLISIDNIGGPVVAIPMDQRPSNVSNTSAYDDRTGAMHVLIKHRAVPGDGKSAASFHYVGDAAGKWTGQKSSFDAADADLAFHGDYLFAFVGRTDAAIFYAERKDGFARWRRMALAGPTPGSALKAANGFASWDVSRLAQGDVTLLWQMPPATPGAPSALHTYDFAVLR